jgi:hypothetical protein
MRISFSASAAIAPRGISIAIAAIAAKIRVDIPGILTPSLLYETGRYFN